MVRAHLWRLGGRLRERVGLTPDQVSPAMTPESRARYEIPDR